MVVIRRDSLLRSIRFLDLNTKISLTHCLTFEKNDMKIFFFFHYNNRTLFEINIMRANYTDNTFKITKIPQIRFVWSFTLYLTSYYDLKWINVFTICFTWTLNIMHNISIVNLLESLSSFDVNSLSLFPVFGNLED